MSTLFDGYCYLDRFEYVPTPYWVILVSLVWNAVLRVGFPILARLFWLKRVLVFLRVYVFCCCRESAAARKQRIENQRQRSLAVLLFTKNYAPTSENPLEYDMETEMAAFDFALRCTSESSETRTQFIREDHPSPSTTWYLDHARRCEDLLDRAAEGDTHGYSAKNYREITFYRNVARTMFVLDSLRGGRNLDMFTVYLLTLGARFNIESSTLSALVEDLKEEFKGKISSIENELKTNKDATKRDTDEVDPSLVELHVVLENNLNSGTIDEHKRLVAQRLLEEYRDLFAVDWYRHAMIMRHNISSTNELEVERLLRYNLPRWRFLMGNKLNAQRLPKPESVRGSCCGTVLENRESIAHLVPIPEADGSLPTLADEYYWTLHYDGVYLDEAIWHGNAPTDYAPAVPPYYAVYVVLLSIVSFASVIWTTANRSHLSSWEGFQLYCMMFMSSSGYRAAATLQNVLMTYRFVSDYPHLYSILSFFTYFLGAVAMIVFIMPMAFSYIWVHLIFVSTIVAGLAVLYGVSVIIPRCPLGRTQFFNFFIQFIGPLVLCVASETLVHYGVSLYHGRNYIGTISNEYHCRNTKRFFDAMDVHNDLYFRNLVQFL